MHSINRGGHLLLTETVILTASENQLTKAVDFNVTASVNTPIFRGGYVIKDRLSKCTTNPKYLSSLPRLSSLSLILTSATISPLSLISPLSPSPPAPLSLSPRQQQ